MSLQKCLLTLSLHPPVLSGNHFRVCTFVFSFEDDLSVPLCSTVSLLSKRLLLSKLAGAHLEEEAVSKMKASFGMHFTSRISRLITNYKAVVEEQK